jgi:hypothetical protein
VIGRAASRCAAPRLRRLIDRHFAARITPREESMLRAHLAGCDSCRAGYDRHILYAELVPGRPRMADRLAAGLGLGPARNPGGAPAIRPARSRRTWVFAAAASAACLALLVKGRIVLAPESEFAVRGPVAEAAGPALEIYRVAENESTKLTGGWMSARGELAFAYRNPAGFSRLLVFGVDDRGGIYWFHPAWTEASQDPVAVPVAAGEGPFELPEAIHHDVRGSRLCVVALFTNAAVSVRAVEEGWRTAQPDPPGSARFETWLEVRP